MNAANFPEAIAAELDRYADVPDEVLRDIVTRDGACMWPGASEVAPIRADEALSDRELAARLCAGCSVHLACLELELRTAGASTVGVWGGLSEQDRRAVYQVWRERRGRSA